MSVLKKLQKICDQNPTSILFARLADGLLQQGEVARAIEVCRRGLRYRPSYTAGHVVMGKCYQATGHYEEARLAFQRVLQLDAGHLAARWYMGKIALQLGRDDLALKYFEQAHVRDPFSLELIEQIRKLKGEEVEEEQDNGPESDGPGVVSESEAFAQALLEKDVEDDLDVLVMSLKREPKSGGEAPVIATTTLAELYASQGLIQEAIAIFEQVIAREPDNEHIIARLDALRNLPESEGL
jgi:tetratricopeptide (TPR) repeat protein